MMVDGAEERQLKGPIDVLAPYTQSSHGSASSARAASSCARPRAASRAAAARPTRHDGTGPTTSGAEQ
jgi:hypothetical protein